jgi:signal peptidase II
VLPDDSLAIAEDRRAHAAPGKVAVALIVIGVVLTLDILTKLWVVRNLAMHYPVPILGDFFRLTYTHNPGAAFGINIGEHSRIFFLVLSIVALGVLAVIYRSTPAADRLRIFALSLVAGGALGNILDRIRYEAGVVDFLDVGFDFYRWPVFNVADSAVSCGAILLLISFYLEGRHERPEENRGA